MQISRSCIVVYLVLHAIFGSHGVASAQTPPTKQAALLKWLQAGSYKSAYTPEPAVRASNTAHGAYVRTWYSPRLSADLRAGRKKFRRGAAMVKELYGSDGRTVTGWAVMNKLETASGPGGRGWLFYELFPGGRPIFGRGVSLCTQCHRVGTDYLLSSFRP